ncbi:hypothetical protein [Hahella ganghwensis]|uniref:hypothetical protein n=1 Tax=Hahella ganghwensis TaxID=286420 RepID=UPI00037B7B49|nr:hypothetical protein [Hahella ganghwensis]
MKKIVVLLTGLLMSLSAIAVQVHSVQTPGGNQKMFDGLVKASEAAAQEMQNVSSKPADFATRYVERFKNGTISRWRLLHKDGTVLDHFYSRNGVDVPRNNATMVEHVSKHASGQAVKEQRPLFARQKIRSESTIPDAITGPDAANDVKRFGDAEIKAIQRAFRTKQKLGYSADDLILEGYVDKPNCPVCSRNLRHFEGIGQGKLAKEIRITHFSKNVHDSSFRPQRGNVVTQVTGCTTVH